MVVIGGIGSITGSVIAAFLFTACSEWWLRGLDSGTWLGISSTLFRAGFRKVVFAVIIMCIVLFASQGLMGTKEFSWDGLINWFKNLPANLKAWPAKHKAKSQAKKEAKDRDRAAKLQAKKDKADSAAKASSGEKLFEPLPVYDHVVVFKEGN